jgi:hypothetical protein
VPEYTIPTTPPPTTGAPEDTTATANITYTVNPANTSKLDPSVAETLPGLYAALQNQYLNPSSANSVAQLAGTVATYRAIKAIPDVKKQAEQYRNLGTDAQNMLNSMYPNEAYAQNNSLNLNLLHDLGLVYKTATSGIAALSNPLILGFKAAGVYNKVINAPYLYGRQLTQGASPFDPKVYSGAWDGNAIYDAGAKAALEKKFGPYNTFVAIGALQGKTPGQILDEYGKTDSNILNALSTYMNNSEVIKGVNFEQMLKNFDAARVSPGRDIARTAYNVPITNTTFYNSNKWKYTSGPIDFTYQILHDPLTYFGGIGEGLRGGEMLSERLANKIKAGDIVGAMSDPKVVQFWDENAGPLIKQYSEARKIADPSTRSVAVSNVLDKIATQAPDINNRNFIKVLSDAKVYDSKSATNFVDTAKDGALPLLAGRVDGNKFLREGVPYAKNDRMLFEGVNRFASDFFGGRISSDLADKVTINTNKLIRIGQATDIENGADATLLQNMGDQTNALNLRNRIYRFTQKHPGDVPINIMNYNVEKTLPVFRSYAILAGYQKPLANALTAAFAELDPANRVTMLRGLYTQIMQAMGVEKSKIQTVLQEKFADLGTFASSKDMYVPAHFEDNLSNKSILESQKAEEAGGLLKTTIHGPIHPYQGKPQIGGLPWSRSAKGAVDLEQYGLGGWTPAQKLINSIGGMTRSDLVRKINNGWAQATLYPRIGLRASIESGINYLLTVPRQEFFKYALGKKINQAALEISDNLKQVPFFKRQVLKAFGVNPEKYVPEKSIYDQADLLIRQGRLEKTTGLNGEEVWKTASKEDVVHAYQQRLEQLVGDNPKYQDWINQLMLYSDHALDGHINSIIANSAFTGSFSQNVFETNLIARSQMTQALKDLKVKPGNWGVKTVEELADKLDGNAVSAAHFRNFWFRFVVNKDTYNKFTDFGVIFMKHDALRTDKDFAAAKSEILKNIGIDPKTLAITSEKALDKYLSYSMERGVEEQKGFSKVDSAVNRVDHQLIDMYNVFHGSAAKPFNENLNNYLKQYADDLQRKSATDLSGITRNYEGSMSKALSDLDFKTFEKLTRLNRPTSTINTDLEFANPNELNWGSKMAETIRNAPKAAMNQMDLQIQWLTNQPFYKAAYIQAREELQGLENRRLIQLLEEDTRTNVSDKDKLKLARAINEKFITQWAQNYAADKTLKYVDNPAIKSNFAWTLRNVGRFYRAEESFMVRSWRIAMDHPIRSFYRLRLANLAIDNAGSIEKDQQGQPYFIMPADNILFHAFNGVLGKLTGNPDIVKQANYSDFSFKLQLFSPSLGSDAGRPSLQGPIIGIPILALKTVFNNLPWAWSKEAGNSIDSAVMGSASSNFTPTKLMPTFFQRLWDLLPGQQQDQQVASAAMVAIAYNADHKDNPFNPDSQQSMTPEQFAVASSKYIDNIKTTALNVLFIKALLGNIVPASPTTIYDKDVPDYLKKVGITGLAPEFADLLQGVMRNSDGLSNPYDAALYAFTQDDPGKVVWTVSKQDKQASTIQSYVKDTITWAEQNADYVNDKSGKYYGAAWIFAPHMGQYDPNSYLMIQNMGLSKQKSLNDYLINVFNAEALQKYYAVDQTVQDIANNPQKYPNTDLAQAAKDATAYKDQLKAAYPMLSAELDDPSTNQGQRMKMLGGLETLLADKNFPISNQVRTKMTYATQLVNQALTAIQATSGEPGIINAPSDKQEIKTKVLEVLKELGGGGGNQAAYDPEIEEATRAIFEPLLNAADKTTITGKVVFK